MFEEIRIRDLGVISSAELTLGPGLTVITGETGAGKTMVLSGLSLLLGGRADAARVRAGASQAEAEGRVTLPADSAATARALDAGAELDEDGSLVLLRTVAAEGRSRAYCGGRSVPQSVLADLAAELVTVHGQADQVRLRSPQRQREAVDEFAGADHRGLVERYRVAWAERAAVLAEIDTLRSSARERAREAELLRLGLAEIERVAPQHGEDLDLAAEIERLGHAEDLRAAAALAHRALVGPDDTAGDAERGAATLVDEGRSALEHVAPHDPALGALATRMAEIGYLAADLAAELSGYVQDLDADPVRLDAAQRRFSELAPITRAYGGTIDEVLAWADESGRRLIDLDGGSDHLEHVEARRAALSAELETIAVGITAGRRAAAATLAAAVTTELAGLAMAQARLLVEARSTEELGPWGRDSVEMLLSPHDGATPQPLGKGASGGELSRIMLAIEVALATGEGTRASRPPTFVFDEVDAGVGGRAAIEVGRRLAELARSAQVIVVTHLAQVAACADRHLVVTKSTVAGAEAVTDSDVREVTGDERLTELARMLSGRDDSEIARSHAAELLEASGMAR